MDDAYITEYGGEMIHGYLSVKHYVLKYKGRWVADTSTPQDLEMFQEIVERINRS